MKNDEIIIPAKIERHPDAAVRVPPGTPPWITADMIADTLEVWRPYYKNDLTEDDAVQIIITVSNLVDVARMLK